MVAGVLPLRRLEGDLLGADGRPLKVSISGQTIFVCCDGCQNELRTDTRAVLADNPDPTLPILKLD